MNLIGAIAVATSVAAFGIAHRMLCQKTLAARCVFFGTFAILSIPALLFTSYYFHFLPEMAWFYTMRSWTGSELLVIFLGGAGGAAATLIPRWLMLLPLLGTMGLAIVPYLKPVMNPLDLGSSEEKWDGDACLQSTASTCGPASTASILKYLGVDASEREIARAAFTSASGTEAWYLARYVRNRGFATRFYFEPTFSVPVGFPAMVGVRIRGYGHFIAVLDVSGKEVTYVDPLSGKAHLPVSEFLQRYVFTGFRMIVSKN